MQRQNMMLSLMNKFHKIRFKKKNTRYLNLRKPQSKIQKQIGFYFFNLSWKQKLLVVYFDLLTYKVTYLVILLLNCLLAL